MRETAVCSRHVILLVREHRSESDIVRLPFTLTLHSPGRHVSDILADEMTGGKVLVFAHHRNVLDALERSVVRTGRVEYIRIDGRTKVGATATARLKHDCYAVYLRRLRLTSMPFQPCNYYHVSRRWSRISEDHPNPNPNPNPNPELYVACSRFSNTCCDVR